MPERFIPTEQQRELIRELAAMDATQVEIAQELRISTSTLTNYFREDIDAGKALGDLKLRRGLMKVATGWMDESRDPTRHELMALLRLSAWRLGYSDTSKHEHSSPNGPIQILISPTDAKL